MGCGHMWMIVVTGAERGAIWCYEDGYDYEPTSIELSAYPPDAHNRFIDTLLGNSSSRLTFWDWYIDWVDGRLAQTPAGSS